MQIIPWRSHSACKQHLEFSATHLTWVYGEGSWSDAGAQTSFVPALSQWPAYTSITLTHCDVQICLVLFVGIIVTIKRWISFRDRCSSITVLMTQTRPGYHQLCKTNSTDWSLADWHQSVSKVWLENTRDTIEGRVDIQPHGPGFC